MGELKTLIGPFSGTDGISPNERRIHTGADSDMAPHLMVSEPLPTGGLDGLVGIKENSVRPRKDASPKGCQFVWSLKPPRRPSR